MKGETMCHSAADVPASPAGRERIAAGAFLLLAASLAAGTATAGLRYGELTGDSARVFREGALLLEEPRAAAPAVGSLRVGELLVDVAGVDVIYEDEGLPCTWMAARLPGEDGAAGYVPLTWLALADLTLEDGSLLLFGLRPHADGAAGVGVLAGENGIEWRVAFRPPGVHPGEPYGYSVSSRREDPTGLSGVSDAVVLSFSYEACGYENRDILLVRTGEILVLGPDASMVSEAGLFRFAEELVLPREPGRDVMMVTATEESWDGATGRYEVVSTDTTRYHWDGLGFTELMGSLDSQPQ